jgi:hypothetical protein
MVACWLRRAVEGVEMRLLGAMMVVMIRYDYECGAFVTESRRKIG